MLPNFRKLQSSGLDPPETVIYKELTEGVINRFPTYMPTL